MALFGFQSIYVLSICYTIVSDFRHLRISNSIIVLLVCTFAAFAAVFLEPKAVLSHVVLALFILSIACVFFAANWIAGGDVKFLTATTLWVGPEHVIDFIMLMAMLGLVLALALICVRKYPYFVVHLPDSWMLRRITALAECGQVPYGVAIGIAAVLTPDSLLMRGPIA
jgi:prepilin peptidase CpaA